MKILIIGKIPPPIGGVTIHTKRLIDNLQKLHYPFVFRTLNIRTLLLLPLFLIGVTKVHLHSSNPYVRLFVSIVARMCRVKSLITFHGNIEQCSHFINGVNKITLHLISIPIVLNDSSFCLASAINKNTRLVSSFIPPVRIAELPKDILSQILELKANVTKLFCTNAYRFTLDKDKQEIYQITNVVDLFIKHQNLGLIVSDPSGTYYARLQEKIKGISNILFIPFPHDFNAVIRECDFMLRFTTTDGDALSVKEALLQKKTVIATNVVSRPKSVILVGLNLLDLERTITTVTPQKALSFQENAVSTLIDIYNEP